MRTLNKAKLMETETPETPPMTNTPKTPPMTPEQFTREAKYREAMTIARTLHSRGLFSTAELKRIDRYFVKKYSPVWGDL